MRGGRAVSSATRAGAADSAEARPAASGRAEKGPGVARCSGGQRLPWAGGAGGGQGRGRRWPVGPLENRGHSGPRELRALHFRCFKRSQGGRGSYASHRPAAGSELWVPSAQVDTRRT